MANSLRAKLSKLRHDGHITEIEYQAFIKKMDGHDAEIRNKVIDEFAERLHELCGVVIGIYQYTDLLHESRIDEIAEGQKGS